jgi:serine/threonine protein kinase
MGCNWSTSQQERAYKKKSVKSENCTLEEKGEDPNIKVELPERGSFEDFANLFQVLNPSDFTVLYLIGEGGIGKVYCAVRKSDGKEVALKFFGYVPNEPDIHQIREEITIMSHFIGISSITQLYGYFMDTIDGILPGKMYTFAYPVIVMELIYGADLFETLDERRLVSAESDLARLFNAMLSSI